LVAIKDLFVEIKDTTGDTVNYPLYSLTIEEGIVPKPERYERSFLLTDKESDNYKIVKSNDVVLNPMNLRWGVVAIHKPKKSVSVSKYYNVIRIKDNSDNPFYYSELFSSDMMLNVYETIATGTLVEKKRVHLSQLVDVYVPRPPQYEQQKIASILSSMDSHIEEKQQKLEQTQSLKKSLMQDLLTGKVRVTVN